MGACPSVLRGVVRALLLLGSGVVTAGCVGVSFQFGGPPVMPLTADPVKRCVYENAILVRPATAEYRTSDSGGPNVVVVTTHQVEGVTFYRGRTRLSVEQVLDLLGDPDLKSAYVGLYRKRLISGRKRHRTGKWLLGFGVPAEVGGLALLMAGMFRNLEGGMVKSPLLWVGVAIAATGAALTGAGAFLLGTAARRINASLPYQQVFFTASLRPALQRALLAYNRRVVRRCAGPGPADRPRAKQLPRARSAQSF